VHRFGRVISFRCAIGFHIRSVTSGHASGHASFRRYRIVVVAAQPPFLRIRFPSFVPRLVSSETHFSPGLGQLFVLFKKGIGLHLSQLLLEGGRRLGRKEDLLGRRRVVVASGGKRGIVVAVLAALRAQIRQGSLEGRLAGKRWGSYGSHGWWIDSSRWRRNGQGKVIRCD